MKFHLKNITTRDFFIFLCGGILILIISYFFLKPYWESIAINTLKIGDSQKILLPGEDICPENHDECIQKINDKTSFADNISTIASHIERGSGGQIMATINFPAFSDRTPEEKKQIIQKINQSGARILTIGIAFRYYEDITGDIQNILSQAQFDELDIRLYIEPMNILEILDAITWKKNPNLKLKVEFINVDLPKDLRIFEYIYVLDKMINRNNGNTPIASFSLLFNPLFYEFSDAYRYVLYPNEGKILKHLSTKELRITGMHTTYASGTHDSYEDQKGRTYDFLNTSPIPKIEIDSIGKKENGIITLYGF